jgi:hypothetical protein
LRLGTPVEIYSGANRCKRTEVAAVGDAVAIDVWIAGIADAIQVEVSLRGVGVAGAVICPDAESARSSRIAEAIQVSVDLPLGAAVGVYGCGGRGSRAGVTCVAYAVSISVKLIEVGSRWTVVRARAERAEAAGIADSVAVSVHLCH